MRKKQIFFEKRLKWRLSLTTMLICLFFSCNKENDNFNMYVYSKDDTLYLKKLQVCNMTYGLYIRVNKNNKKWHEIAKNKEMDSLVIEYNDFQDVVLPKSLLSSNSVSSKWIVSVKQTSNHFHLLHGNEKDSYEFIEILYNRDLNDQYLKDFLSDIPECSMNQ